VKENPLIPVVLCGGSGTRLWPLSRASYPKQYWALGDTSNESTLLQQTHQRLKGLNGLESPLLICHEDHRFIVAEQMRQIDIEPSAILLEPIGRNTAPAIAVAALQATENGADPLLLVLSADHLIKEAKQFREVIEAGKSYANKGRLVTFGIIPTSPETGYGYIEALEPLNVNEAKGVAIKRFVEKPDLQSAEKFLKDNSNDSMVNAMIATSYQKLSKFKEAIYYYEKTLNNQNANLLNNYFQIGSCYANLNQNNNAAKYFKRTLKINPDFAPSRFQLINVYQLLNKNKEAKKECDILFMLDRNLYNTSNFCTNL